MMPQVLLKNSPSRFFQFVEVFFTLDEEARPAHNGRTPPMPSL